MPEGNSVESYTSEQAVATSEVGALGWSRKRLLAFGLGASLLLSSCGDGFLGLGGGDNEADNGGATTEVSIDPTTSSAETVAPFSGTGEGEVLYGSQTARDIMDLPVGDCKIFFTGRSGDMILGEVRIWDQEMTDEGIYGIALDFSSDQDPEPWNGGDIEYNNNDSLKFEWNADWVEESYPDSGLTGFMGRAALDVDGVIGDDGEQTLDVQCIDSDLTSVAPVFGSSSTTAVVITEAPTSTAAHASTTQVGQGISCQIEGAVDGTFVSAWHDSLHPDLQNAASKTWDVWLPGHPVDGARFDTDEGVRGSLYDRWGGAHLGEGHDLAQDSRVDGVVNVMFTRAFDIDGDGRIDVECEPFEAAVSYGS